MSELPEGWRFNPVNGGVFAGHDMVLSLLFLRTLLASQGLSIVDAKDTETLRARVLALVGNAERRNDGAGVPVAALRMLLDQGWRP